MFLSVIFIITVLAACGSEKHDEAMDNGMDSIENEKYEEAADFFQVALDEKEDDDKASTYLEQTKSLIDGIDTMSDGDFEEATQFFQEIEDTENGLSNLEDVANEKLDEIDKIESLYTEVEDALNKAEEESNEGNYQEALKIIEEVLANDLSHAYIEEIEEKLSTLKSDTDSNKEVKKKAEKAYGKAEELEEEEKYDEATIEIDKALENDFDHPGLKASKKDLNKLKESIASKEEEKEKKKKEQEVLDDLSGYWAEDVDGSMTGKKVYKISSEESMWAVLSSGSAGYDEISSFDISENQKKITLNTSEEEIIEVTNLDENKMTLDGLEYRKVSQEEMQEILESAGAPQRIDDFFDAENIKGIEDFNG